MTAVLWSRYQLEAHITCHSFPFGDSERMLSSGNLVWRSGDWGQAYSEAPVYTGPMSSLASSQGRNGV